MEDTKEKRRYVTGPDGAPLTVADLPTADHKHWLVIDKAKVVHAVRGGLISLKEAEKRYRLSVDEFLAWQRAYDTNGMEGLKKPKRRS